MQQDIAPALLFIASIVTTSLYRKLNAKSSSDIGAIKKSLPDELNPLHHVKNSCRSICARASSVFIETDALGKLADSISEADIASLMNGVSWDEYQWHFSDDAHVAGPLTCQYILVLDALNFCFWPEKDLEYDVLAKSLKDVLTADNRSFNAYVLANMTDDALQAWFPHHTIPLLSERAARLREVGAVLQEKFGGLASNLVRASGHSAPALVRLIIESFPGFRDATVFEGKFVHFYKRAQILVGDIWAAYNKPGPGHPFFLDDISQLTTFADYRVPQILRHEGVLVYSDELAAVVDSKKVIASSTAFEVEIRASTIVAVDMLHQILSGRGFNLTVIELDWLLWQKGEVAKDRINPHHRTLTIFY